VDHHPVWNTCVVYLLPYHFIQAAEQNSGFKVSLHVNGIWYNKLSLYEEVSKKGFVYQNYPLDELISNKLEVSEKVNSQGSILSNFS